MTDEIELETYILGEVINARSNDYMQTLYFTHKLVDGIGETWFKASTNYSVEHTSELWFKDSEIDWYGVLDEEDL